LNVSTTKTTTTTTTAAINHFCAKSIGIDIALIIAHLVL
jgi:hypothetical protein